MKSKLIMVGLIVVIVLSLLACAPASKEVSAEVSIDDFMSQKHISKEVEICAGGLLTVILGSNPTTGFSWSEEAQISAPSVLKQVSHEYVAPESGLVGAAGQEIWKFEALREGTATISMEYGRPWEGGEKGEWTYTLNVTVK